VEEAWTIKAEVDAVKDRLIGQEERTREAWLAIQRRADLGADGGLPKDEEEMGNKGTGSTVVEKPRLGEWKGRSKFL
jgi:hypothetical protein